MGIHNVVPQVIVGAAVVRVGTALDNRAYERPCAAPIFGIEGTAHDAEFLQSVGVGQRGRRAGIDIHIAAAIQYDVVVAASGSVNRNSIFLREANPGAGLVDTAGYQRLQT